MLAAGDNMFGQISADVAERKWAFIALGDTSATGVAADGVAWVWGGEDEAPLARMSMLETFALAKVAHGSEHALALDANGAVIAWGRADHGQLGRGAGGASGGGACKPKRVRGIGPARDVVAVGNASYVLVDDGTVVAAGANEYGQLGTGSTHAVDVFAPVALPVGVPITAIAAGAAHVLLLDFDGGLWAAGSNRVGQLGLGADAVDARPRKFPLHIPGLDAVVAIGAAANASAALTAGGTLYTWGDGSRGVLGSGAADVQPAPRAVALGAAAAASFVLGPTALFVRDAEAVVWACGSTSSGQLLLPEDVAGAAADERGRVLAPVAIPGSAAWAVAGVALGTDVTLVLLADDGTVPGDGLGFAITPQRPPLSLSWSALSNVHDVGEYAAALKAVFTSPPSLNMSFVVPGTRDLDLEHATAFFEHVHELPPSSRLRIALSAHVLKMCRSLVPPVSDSPPSSLRFLHLLSLAFDAEDIALSPDAFVDALATFFRVVANLPPSLAPGYARVVASYPTRAFGRLVSVVVSCFDGILAPYTHPANPAVPIKAALPPAIHHVLAMLATLWRANAKRSANDASPTAALPPEAFAAPSLRPSPQALTLISAHAGSYAAARASATQLGPTAFNVFKTPFVIPLASKDALLRAEAKTRQNAAVQQAALSTLASGSNLYGPPALHLPLRRDAMAGDLVSLLVTMDPELDVLSDLPLRIQFADEEGVDEGGLTRELVSSAAHQLFAQEFGMFLVSDDGYVSINACSPAELAEFKAVGRFAGLALYAGAQLGIHFPPHFLAALLNTAYGRPEPTLTLADLAVVDPVLASSLGELLAFAGDVEATFCASFAVDISTPTGSTTIELLPDGASIPVTAENRETYVDKYVRAVLVDAVAEPFAAFAAGFVASAHLAHSAVAPALTAHELGLLLAGSDTLDLGALRANTRYAGGYTAESPPVVAFWDYALGLSTTDKKRMLKFVTGSDIAPPGGLGTMPFVIQRAGGDVAGRLPSAHTCFNSLLLPPYETPEALAAAFALALDAGQGFGLR